MHYYYFSALLALALLLGIFIGRFLPRREIKEIFDIEDLPEETILEFECQTLIPPSTRHDVLVLLTDALDVGGRKFILHLPSPLSCQTGSFFERKCNQLMPWHQLRNQ